MVLDGLRDSRDSAVRKRAMFLLKRIVTGLASSPQTGSSPQIGKQCHGVYCGGWLVGCSESKATTF